MNFIYIFHNILWKQQHQQKIDNKMNFLYACYEAEPEKVQSCQMRSILSPTFTVDGILVQGRVSSGNKMQPVHATELKRKRHMLWDLNET